MIPVTLEVSEAIQSDVHECCCSGTCTNLCSVLQQHGCITFVYMGGAHKTMLNVCEGMRLTKRAHRDSARTGGMLCAVVAAGQ
jgi:hypothetical protein